MTAYYPIVIETETTGAVSAYVPGLPVYAAADTRAKAERAILKTLAAYLDVHPTTSPTTRIRVARVSDDPKSKVHVVASLVGVGALLGTGRSVHKANASRANGRLGGRPRHADRKTTKALRRA
jgi:predicted RNase H-like HicB family nuclease